MQEAAAYYAGQLLAKYGVPGNGSEIEFKAPIVVQELKNAQPVQTEISFKTSEVQRLLGVTLEVGQIEQILTDIGCQVSKISTPDSQLAAELLVKVPSWRPDLTIPADLVEEIGRIWGYDKIPNILPCTSPTNSKSLAKSERNIKSLASISNALAARGFTEVISYPFTAAGTVEIVNPLASDKAYLCETLLEPLVETASLNVRRANSGVKLFEVGKAFQAKKSTGELQQLPVGEQPEKAMLGKIEALLPDQPTHICAIVVHNSSGVSNATENWKYIVQEALNVLNIANLQTNTKVEVVPFGTHEPVLNFTRRSFHPTRSADIVVNGTIVGRAGELNAEIIQSYNLADQSAAFEINFDKLSKFRANEPFNVVPISTFPTAHEDYAFVVDAGCPAVAVSELIKKAVTKIDRTALPMVKLFDEFHSDKFGKDKKSLSFEVVVRSDHTLSGDDIKQIRNQIIADVESSGGHLRD
jgi:phenylalanyl-tRNA synthetase beta chain